jgi:hypothetical protein
MGIWYKNSLLVTALLLSSCGEYPRDPEDTLKLVQDRGTFRVGLISGGHMTSEKDQMLIDRIAKATKARPILSSGQAEPLLLDLEEGKLDLVLGTFDEKTPWATRLTVGPALTRSLSGKTSHHLAPVMRNGENAWISLIESEVRDLAPEAQ